MTEDNRFSKTELIVGITATVIALGALLLTIHQGKLNRKFMSAEYRPHFWIEVTIHPAKESKENEEFIVFDKIPVDYNYFNDGKTAAYPLIFTSIILPYDINKINLRDKILSGDINSVYEYRFPIKNTTSNVVIGGHLDNISTQKFTKAILSNQKYSNTMLQAGLISKTNMNFFVHVYTVYKDEFEMYYDYYQVTEAVMTEEGFKFTQPLVDIKTYKKNPLPKEIRFSNYFDNSN